MNYWVTSIKRVFAYAAAGAWRNRINLFFSGAALSFLFFFMHCAGLGVAVSGGVIDNVQQKIDIAVFLQNSADSFQEEAFRLALERKKKTGEIRDYWKLDKDEAFMMFKEQYPAQTRFLERYQLANPLSTVFGITPQPGAAGAATITQFVLEEQWQTTVDQNRFRQSTEERARAQRVMTVLETSRTFIYALQTFFFAIGFVLVLYFVSEAIRRHHREMVIMRLVGARFFFIRMPYLIEGLLVTAIALIFSIFLFARFLDAVRAAANNMLAGLGIEESFIETALGESTSSNIVVTNGFFMILLSAVAAFVAIEWALRKRLFHQI